MLRGADRHREGKHNKERVTLLLTFGGFEAGRRRLDLYARRGGKGRGRGVTIQLWKPVFRGTLNSLL